LHSGIFTAGRRRWTGVSLQAQAAFAGKLMGIVIAIANPHLCCFIDAHLREL